MTAPGKTVVLGIGGGGGKILDCLAGHHTTSWLEIIHIDADDAMLAGSDAIQTISIGTKWCRGHGCGGDMQLGQRATAASIEVLKARLQNTDLLIVVACLGRGTASGGIQILARLVREMQLLAFFFVTMPFAVEGNGRRETAETAVSELRKNADIVVAIENDLLFTTVPADTKADDAFRLADKILADGVMGIAELIRCRGLISVDFASVRTLLKNRDAFCSFGIGRAKGKNRTKRVVDELFKSPMMGGDEIVSRASAVVATLIGGKDLQIGETNECLSRLNSRLGPSTKTYIGANVIEDKTDGIQLTLIAVRYVDEPAADAEAETRIEALPPKRSKSGKYRTQIVDDDRQFDLPFAEETLSVGIFGNVSATTYAGENLDIPTFQRRGVILDLET